MSRRDVIRAALLKHLTAQRSRDQEHDYGIDDLDALIEDLAALMPEVEIQESLGRPTECRVKRNGVLVFDGVDRSALLGTSSDLAARLERAIDSLKGVQPTYWEPSERVRIHGKIEGVALALSYLREERT